MSESYRVVRLLKNHIYPTYQLHAFMGNGKTAPRDGLRLAALILSPSKAVGKGNLAFSFPAAFLFPAKTAAGIAVPHGLCYTVPVRIDSERTAARFPMEEHTE